jgi:WD40 repeat protein
VRIWDGSDGKIKQTVDISSQDSTVQCGIAYNHKSSALAVAYSPTNGPAPSMIRVWRGEMSAPSSEFPTAFPNGAVTIAIRDDGNVIATANDHGFNPFFLWDAWSGKLLSTFEASPDGMSGSIAVEFSPSGRYLLISRQVWEVSNPASPTEFWTCPEDDHAFGDHIYYRWGKFLPDERHVIVGHDAEFQIWDILEKDKIKAKKLTIYLLPDSQWVMFNHRTHHWSASSLAGQFMQLRLNDSETGISMWLTPIKYQDRTGFKPDATKAGLDFLQVEFQKSVN